MIQIKTIEIPIEDSESYDLSELIGNYPILNISAQLCKKPLKWHILVEYNSPLEQFKKNEIKTEAEVAIHEVNDELKRALRINSIELFVKMSSEYIALHYIHLIKSSDISLPIILPQEFIESYPFFKAQSAMSFNILMEQAKYLFSYCSELERKKYCNAIERILKENPSNEIWNLSCENLIL